MTPELRAFCDRVIVPALVERFLEQQQPQQPPAPPKLSKKDDSMPAPTEQIVASPTSFPPSPWLTVNEAADRARCGTRLIYRAVSAGKLRAVRLGGRRELRVLAEWLDGWLLDQAPLLDTQGRLVGTNGSRASS